MDDTLNVSVMIYRDEVVVEVIDTDEYGEPDAITYQFEYGEDQQILDSKQSIESEHTSAVEIALDAKGYQRSS